jgi:hypothetical protein
MNRVISLLLMLLFVNGSKAQNRDPRLVDTIIIGPEKYLAKVTDLFEKYDCSIDSLAYTQSSANNERNLNNNLECYLINRQLTGLEKVGKEFLNIKRVIAAYHNIKAQYYEVVFETDSNGFRSIRVRWYTKDSKHQSMK